MDGAKVFRIMQNYSNKRKILPRHQILLHSAGYSSNRTMDGTQNKGVIGFYIAISVMIIQWLLFEWFRFFDKYLIARTWVDWQIEAGGII